MRFFGVKKANNRRSNLRDLPAYSDVTTGYNRNGKCTLEGDRIQFCPRYCQSL